MKKNFVFIVCSTDRDGRLWRFCCTARRERTSKSVPNEEISEESVDETNTDDTEQAAIQIGDFEAET